MIKKTILFLFIFSLIFCGFAQKSKRKTTQKSSKNSHFVMLINGKETPAENYCPNEDIIFDFAVLDSTIENYKYYWVDDYHNDTIRDITPITFAFPIKNYRVFLFFTIHHDSIPFDTLINNINVDFSRTELKINICQGRDITVSTNTHGDLTYYNVLSDFYTPWDTLVGNKCDSLVRWYIEVDPYILEEYSITSCDSVIWGDSIVKRSPDHEGDYLATMERIYFADNPDNGCDTLKILNIIIIQLRGQLELIFDQEAFCDGEDMSGTIDLETNFTAFDWTYIDRDSTITQKEKNYQIEYPGYYHVYAYMDTSLYDTLKDLRIVATCSLEKDTLVNDCELIIPNVITPNDDGINDWFGIKKLNPERENELTIYDRWGKTVFHKKNYKCIYKGSTFLNKEDAFTGLSRGGQKLPDGTYYYAFKYASIPKPKKYTGTLVILR
jgi:gliding motility-associated-like protein